MNLKDPKVQKIMLGVMTMVIASYVYFATNFLPFNYPVRRAQIQALDSEYSKLSAELEKARKTVGNLAQLEAEYQRLHAQWKLAQELLPEEKEMPELLRQVTAAGQNTGVNFALFEPQAPRPSEFYTDHPIKIKVRGGYHQVGLFLSRLSNLERIVNVSALDLVQPKASNKKKSIGKDAVEAEFTLSAYTLLGGMANEDVQAASTE